MMDDVTRRAPEPAVCDVGRPVSPLALLSTCRPLLCANAPPRPLPQSAPLHLSTSAPLHPQDFPSPSTLASHHGRTAHARTSAAASGSGTGAGSRLPAQAQAPAPASTASTTRVRGVQKVNSSLPPRRPTSPAGPPASSLRRQSLSQRHAGPPPPTNRPRQLASGIWQLKAPQKRLPASLGRAVSSSAGQLAGACPASGPQPCPAAAAALPVVLGPWFLVCGL